MIFADSKRLTIVCSDSTTIGHSILTIYIRIDATTGITIRCSDSLEVSIIMIIYFRVETLQLRHGYLCRPVSYLDSSKRMLNYCAS